jgi:hypothetical protein
LSKQPDLWKQIFPEMDIPAFMENFTAVKLLDILDDFKKHFHLLTS